MISSVSVKRRARKASRERSWLIHFTFLLILNVFMILLIACQNEKEKNLVQIIPLPVQYEVDENGFFEPDTAFIQADPELDAMAGYLEEWLQTVCDLQVRRIPGDWNAGNHGNILLSIHPDGLKPEGYSLVISDKNIIISGYDSSGVFYGIQSLLQLVSAAGEKSSKLRLPFMTITDYPRFRWRGMHLDVSRHFFPKEFIRKYIDILASCKLNVFHWHLTDDQGWRIEIKSYPKLTESAAWCKGTGLEKWTYFVEAAEKDAPRYGGFYTQEEIREIVAYASERCITIVPEIELPGHSWAVLNAYPELSCSGKSWKKPDDVVFEFSDPFCAGNEKTFRFFEQVFSEIVDLFPSEYIHIGGDEAKKVPWENCPKCRKRLKEENLQSVEELQSYFIKRIERMLAAKGRRIIGWDEILEGGLAPGAAVMSWRGEEGGIAAAQAGHPVVMIPNQVLYFNNAQYDAVMEGVDVTPVNTMERVYAYDPLPDALSEEDAANVLGAQAALWSENVYTGQQAEERILPRLCALAEVVWSPQNSRDWSAFKSRLDKHLAYFEKMNYTYFIPPPAGLEDDLFIDGSFIVKLEKPYADASVYYTVDGSIPGTESLHYTEPIVVSDNTQIQAVSVMPSGRSSLVCSATYRKGELREAVQDQGFDKGFRLRIFSGSIQTLDDFASLQEADKAIVERIAIPSGLPEDHFGLEFNGYIKIPKDGVYTFFTESDDGSRLYLNDELLVDNDGIHGMKHVSAKAALKKGYHRLKLQYFEALYGQALNLQYKGDGIEKQPVPESMLFH